jgi:hypothetical protein
VKVCPVLRQPFRCHALGVRPDEIGHQFLHICWVATTVLRPKCIEGGGQSFDDCRRNMLGGYIMTTSSDARNVNLKQVVITGGRGTRIRNGPVLSLPIQADGPSFQKGLRHG